MPCHRAPPPQPQSLPDRIRPLEGAGFYNLMVHAGYERRRWRWAGPVSAALIVVGILYLLAKGIGL